MENNLNEFKRKLSELLIEYGVTITSRICGENTQIFFTSESTTSVTEECQTNYIDGFGFKVRKYSDKPFKSGFKTNTVKGIKLNPFSGKQGYFFHEDDSIVDIFLCERI